MPEYTSPFAGGLNQGTQLWNQIQAGKMAKQKLKEEQENDAFNNSNSLGYTGKGLGVSDQDVPISNARGLPFKEKEILANQARQLNQQNQAQNKIPFYENQLRDEFNTKSKPFETIVPMYRNVISSATTPNPTAQTDMGLIFSYMKILDPNSTVREGEYATAQNAGSIPDAVRNQFNRLIDGEKLQPGQRINFAKSAQQAFQGANSIQSQHMDRYRGLAMNSKVNPDMVIYDYGKGMGKETFDAPVQGQDGFDPVAEIARVRQRRASATQRPTN